MPLPKTMRELLFPKKIWKPEDIARRQRRSPSSSPFSVSQDSSRSPSPPRDLQVQESFEADKTNLKSPELQTEPLSPKQEQPLPETNGHKPRFLAAIDQGTTSSRFIIFDEYGNLIASHQKELSRIHEHSGWHEQDPWEIIGSVEACVHQAINKFVLMGYSPSDIETVGISSQRETAVVWDWDTGLPLRNSIAWPDTRTAPLVRELRLKPGSETLQSRCGLPLSTYPSSVKLTWLLRHDPIVQDAYNQGRLAFGTVDTWLIWNINGGVRNKVYVTDVTNACRTMFADLRTLQYDDFLLDFFEVDRSKIHLPTIMSSSHPTAFGRIIQGPLAGIRIGSCLGDQSAALVGHCAFSPGQAKNTYGTGCFLLYNVGEEPVESKHGLLATVGYQLGPDSKPAYALEGSVAVAGSGVNFLTNNLGFFQDARKIDDEALTVPNNGGCIFVTAFSGLFAPYWIDDAQGTIFGITQHTQRGHISRATLEAVCFQTKAILDSMALDSGKKLCKLAVDGGLSNSNVCMQSQADIIQIPVERPSMHEITALGAAIAAGLATGIWANVEQVKAMGASNLEQFLAQVVESESAHKFKLWSKAVQMSRGWLESAVLEEK